MIRDLHIFIFSWVDIDYDRFLFNWSPTASCFNSVVVSVHLHSEISRFSPISPPTVSANPVLDVPMGLINSPTHNRYLVVEGGGKVGFCKNPSVIRMELSCCLESASDWTSRINLCFHLFSSSDSTIFHHSPHRISFLGIAFTCRITIFALLNIHAFSGLINWRVNSLIRLASLFRDSRRKMWVVIHTDRVSSFTTSSHLTIQNHLSWKSHIRPGTLSLNINSIR